MTDNDNLDLKKRSRRRLVGAAAIALLAAIVLPMVMDQEPRPPAEDIQITIPDREADAALSLPIASPPAAPVAPPFVQSPEEQPSSPDNTVEADSVPVAPLAEPKPPSPARSTGTAPKPVEPNVRPAPERPTATSSADEAARALALLEGKKPGAASTGESFVVQIGAFGEASKATALGAELKRRGFAAYTEKAGAVTRVRIGPFGSREEADKAAERLRLSGMSGVVVQR
ncbi:SPOR domain-containing protein [Aromatoleum aromaticum]|uniref:SPOR domain-containing protein n=1 Tax=Aromatoleum aromaticum TaxID=551760 RepID=UPI001459D684|nr:SPOR domain-containing protein [Aromatoleum aromaticum]NMG53232.1 SPOR domain-containing protein [Aromatoleum aromaticum]